MHADPALGVERAVKAFGSELALDDCSFTIPAGVVCALVGRNGSGKTTILRAAAGLVPLDSGQMSVDGEPVAFGSVPRFAFLAQGKPLHAQLSVDETLRYASRLASGAFDLRRARDWMDEHGVALGRRVGSLSGGQRTQVALAAAVGRDVPLVALDEPMAELDPLARESVGTRLRDLAREGRTVLVSSHAVAELAALCDHVVVLDAGRVVLAGSVQDVAGSQPLEDRILDVLRAERDRRGSRRAS